MAKKLLIATFGIFMLFALIGILYFGGVLGEVAFNQTSSGIDGYSFTATEYIVHPGQTIGVNAFYDYNGGGLHGGSIVNSNSPFPSCESPGMCSVGSCALGYTVPIGIARVYLDNSLVYAKPVLACAPKHRSANFHGNPFVSGNLFEVRSKNVSDDFVQSYWECKYSESWSGPIANNYLDITIPNDTIGLHNVTITFEEIMPNWHNRCNKPSSKITSGKTVRWISYNGETKMINTNGEFPVVTGKIDVKPPKCTFDSATEAIGFYSFESNSVITKSAFPVKPVKFCYIPAPTYIDLEKQETGTNYKLASILNNGGSFKVPVGQDYNVPFVYKKFGNATSCSESKPYDFTNKKCGDLSGFTYFCGPGKFLVTDENSTHFGACMSFASLCGDGVFDKDLWKCVYLRCNAPDEWISEFKQCGRPISFDNLCNYDVSTSYDWDTNSCLWDMGRTDWETFAGKSACTSRGGEYKQVEAASGSGLYIGECTLPINPSLAEGRVARQGNDRVWSVLGTTPSCEEISPGSRPAKGGEVCVVQNQTILTVDKYIVRNQTITRLITRKVAYVPLYIWALIGVLGSMFLALLAFIVVKLKR